MKKLSLILFAALSVFGCSNQWRDVGVSYNKGQVVQNLYSQSTMATSMYQGAYADLTFWSMLQSQSVLYYAESSEHFGTPEAVMPMTDLMWLDPTGTVYSSSALSSLNVYLLFDSASNPSQAALLVSFGVAGYEGTVFRFLASSAPASFDGGVFKMNLMTDDGITIQLRSRDVSGSSLKNAAQFQVYSVDDLLIGKFSTLVKVD